MYEVKKLLKESGWYEGRCIDTSHYERWYNNIGFEMHDSAKRFLQEYGDLSIHFEEVTLGKSYDLCIAITPIDLIDDEDVISRYRKHFNDELLPVLDKNDWPACCYIGKNSEFYLAGDDWGVRLPHDFDELMFRLINGIKTDGVTERILRY